MIPIASNLLKKGFELVPNRANVQQCAKTNYFKFLQSNVFETLFCNLLQFVQHFFSQNYIAQQ